MNKSKILKKSDIWKGKPITELTNQYLSNILWYLEINWSTKYYLANSVFKIKELLVNRGIERLPYKPILDFELEYLEDNNMIKPNGDIIGTWKKHRCKVIGSIKK